MLAIAIYRNNSVASFLQRMLKPFSYTPTFASIFRMHYKFCPILIGFHNSVILGAIIHHHNTKTPVPQGPDNRTYRFYFIICRYYDKNVHGAHKTNASTGASQNFLNTSHCSGNLRIYFSITETICSIVLFIISSSDASGIFLTSIGVSNINLYLYLSSLIRKPGTIGEPAFRLRMTGPFGILVGIPKKFKTIPLLVKSLSPTRASIPFLSKVDIQRFIIGPTLITFKPL